MIVRKIEDLKEIEKQIAPEILNNRAFERIFYWETERPLREGLQEDIRVSEDGKKIMMISDVKTLRNVNLPVSKLYAHEIELKDNGNIETTTSYGELYEPNAYYRTTDKRPSYSVSSVLNTTYSHTVFDKEGIELAHGTYYKFGWGLSDQTRYDDASEFKKQLLSNGYHKPADWLMGEPKAPMYVGDDTFVVGVNRSSNPALATTFKYDIEPINKFRKNVEYGCAYVHTEWPERIRIDDYNIFAKNNGTGEYELTEEYKKQYPGLTFDDVMREISLACEQYFEASNTKKSGDGYYEILKERLDKANEQYKKGNNMHK